MLGTVWSFVKHASDFVITVEVVFGEKADCVRPAKFSKSDLGKKVKTMSLDKGATADIGLSEIEALNRPCTSAW